MLNDVYTLSQQAGRQLAAVIDRVDRESRSRRPLRRRDVCTSGPPRSVYGIAKLLESLAYGTSVGAAAELYGGFPGFETPKLLIAVFPWKLLPGDSIDAGFLIDVARVNGFWYLRNKSCEAEYSSSS